jgi:hypothetical protein
MVRIPKIDLRNFVTIFVILLILAAIFFGCNKKYTPEKAIAAIEKADYKQPIPTAKWFANKYPCVPLKPPPLATTDSIAYKQWKRETDSLIKNYEDLLNAITPEIIIDSSTCEEKQKIYLSNEKKYKEIILETNKQVGQLKNKLANIKPVKDSIPVPYPVKDSAGLKVLYNLIDVSNAQVVSLKSDLEKQTNKKDWWRKIAIIMGLLFIVSVALRFIKIKIPFL